MLPKLLEIRDRGTFIPALAIEVSGEDGYLLRRAGYGSPLILLINLVRPDVEYDPYAWDNPRTMGTAHDWIQGHWAELFDGDVVDVEFILGETQVKKVSEWQTAGNV